MSRNTEIWLEGESLLDFIWHDRKRFRKFTLWRIVSVLLITPFPVITQRIVDDSIPARDQGEILFYTLLSLALLAAHLLTRRVAVLSMSVKMQSLMRRLRSLVFYKLNFMHFRFLDATQTGRLLSKYAIDTSNIEYTTIILVTLILPEILRSLVLLAALAVINLWLLLIALISIPLFAVVRFYFYHKLESTNRSVRLAREKMTGQANELISAIRLVRGFGQEKSAGQRLSVLSDAYSEEREAQMKLNQSMGYILFTAITAITICAIGFAGYLVVEDRLSVGAMVAMAGALPICLQPVNLAVQFSIQYTLGAESFGSIRELVDSRYVEAWQGTFRPAGFKGKVEFENVSFTYAEGESEAISGFSCSILPGQSVALVGVSGSGKSTLVSLMLGFYAADSGEIRIDGVPQRDLDIRHFRRNCAIVMQENLLLTGSILDNIRFGKPNATVEEVRQVAREANALEFIENLENGFETLVGERGASLSGGQRQRIAIARALLRDPRLLILDEATSALDYESEKHVQEAMEHLAEGRTTISITHRLGTIRRADRIIVFKQGRKLVEGTWDELLAQPGEFRNLIDAQS